MTEGNAIIHLGDLTKPATVLIEKISAAIGGLYKPYQIRRVAKAESDAEIMRAQAQIEITDLQRRAIARFIAEEGKKQDNIERITEKAVPLLKETAAPQNMENDWITNYFDKCRIISDEEMQILWAKVLAGEANTPGVFSKRTVNLLGSLDKSDAQLFTTLCGYIWLMGVNVPLIFDDESQIYNNHGIYFSILTHLDDIGLISLNSVMGFRRTEFKKRTLVQYYDNLIAIEFNKQEKNELDIGMVILTSSGEQLSRICDSKPVEGFLEYVLEKWAKSGLILMSPYPRRI